MNEEDWGISEQGHGTVSEGYDFADGWTDRVGGGSSNIDGWEDL